MKNLRNFKIYYTCQFGMAFFHLRAKSFDDALSRLSEYHKKNLDCIYDDEQNEYYYPEI